MSADAPRLGQASLRFDHMPSEGRTLKVAATAEERAELTAFLEVTDIPDLSVELAAQKFRDGIRVTGTLRATVVQPSVVTLEPVTQAIEEPIDRVFLPGRATPYQGPAGAEIFVDLEDADSPDYFEGPDIDLSDLVIEALALAIDPYPRAPGETIADELPADDDSDFSPFAGLKSLKNPNDT